MDFTHLVKIRLIQLRHHLKNLGIIYFAALVILAALVFIAAYNQIGSKPSAWVAVALISFTILQIHVSRKDRWFVLAHLLNPELNMFTEYLMYLNPVVLIFILKGFFLQAVTTIVLIFSISHIKLTFDSKNQSYHLLKFIPNDMFEWKSGLKKVYYPVLILLVVSLALSGYRIISIFIIWIISMMFSGFYNENESLQMLFSSGLTAKKILTGKIVKALKLFYVLSLPALVLNIVFNPDDWWLVLLFIITQSVFIIFIICLKYATYQPNKKYAVNGVLLGLSQLSVVIPFLLPVPLFLSIRYYFKSLNNLNGYT